MLKKENEKKKNLFHIVCCARMFLLSSERIKDILNVLGHVYDLMLTAALVRATFCLCR